MAHGFLSYQDGRGVSELEQQLTRIVGDQIEDYSKKLYNALRNRMLRVEEVAVDTNEQVSQLSGSQPLKLKGSEPAAITGGSFSRLVGREQSALPGSRATPTTPMGGAIVNMGFGGSRLKPEGFVNDQVIDISAKDLGVERINGNSLEGDNTEVVQAIDRLTFVTMGLLSATKEQTDSQEKIASDQENFLEKAQRKSIASAEENFLEKGSFLSGTSGYNPVGAAAFGFGSGGGSGSRFNPTAMRRGAMEAVQHGGKLSKFIQTGAKTLPKGGGKIPTTAVKRGTEKLLKEVPGVAADTARTAANGIAKMGGVRPGAGSNNLEDVVGAVYEGSTSAKITKQGGDMFITNAAKNPAVAINALDAAGKTSPEIAKALDLGTSLVGTSRMLKMFSGPAMKTALKKVPLVAGLAGIAFGLERMMKGDFLGGGLEIASGLMGATGVGAGASLAIDGYLIARDFGLTPFNQGGIPLGQNVPALLNDRPDKAREAVMPLTDETFLKFGEGNLRALERNRGKYVRLEAEVLAQAIEMSKDDRSWWQKLLGIGDDGDDSGSGNDGKSKKAWWDPLGVFTGNDEAESRTPMLTPPPPLPPITGTDSVSMARSLIVDKEGFEETPYWDVNAYRAGYGSDTYTLADGTVKQVQQGVNITRADADRDIDRRISTEFMPEARRAIGPDIWDSLPAAAQAALTSIAYNYGSVPGRVTRVAKSTNGNIEAIASAVEGLKNDDGGINSGRRQHEADMIRSSAGQAAASLTPPPAIGDQSSITPATVDNGGVLSSTSQQVATAALAPKQTPIVQNIITGGQQQQQGTNVPNQVAFGTSHASQGGDLYSNMRVRSLVG